MNVRSFKNSYIAEICKRQGEPDHLRAVRRFVGEYRRSGETLECLAQKLGVSAIIKEKLPFAGGVFSDEHGLRIKLNSLSPLTRQRFTLAHELAHLMLDSKRAGSARRCLLSSALERACDAVAAELLMPLEEVSRLSSRDASVDALLALARHFDASLHATAVRVKEVSGWKESIGFWKWNGEATELWFVGKRCWPERRLNLHAFELAMKSPGAVRTREERHDLGKGAYWVSVEVRRLGVEYLLGVLRC
jgi:hypothetical protein